jgi:hypothetical protein
MTTKRGSRSSFKSSSLRVGLGTVVVLGAVAAAISLSAARADSDASPLLQQAMRFRVAVHKNRKSGLSIPVYHCRQAKEGCDRRLMEFAHYLIDAGDRYQVDPWLLAAMAFRESGMNPFAVGGVGELGILQLHPKNPRSKHVRFVHDQWYRKRCKKEAGACQREVVERAAEILARSLDMCGGDLKQALGAYNSGKCDGSKRYVARILSERDALKGAVGLQ